MGVGIPRKFQVVGGQKGYFAPTLIFVEKGRRQRCRTSPFLRTSQCHKIRFTPPMGRTTRPAV